MNRLFIIFFCLTATLFSETIDTFYGPLEVDEKVLLDLIHSPAFQRLKHIHQYGVAFYTKTHGENYTRYDHSLGVFALLRLKKASLEEQVAGLLHDVSHTAFSHVGDWVFGIEFQEQDYQSTVHKLYLATSGLETILSKHGFSIAQIQPKLPHFKMLEQSLPDLCADRIDYNIQGAFYQNFLTKEEALDLVHNLEYTEGKWIIRNKDLAEKLMRFSLYMTEHCWGSAFNYVTSCWLADSILEGFKTGLITWKEFHFSTDDIIWNKLEKSDNPIIKQKMTMLKDPHKYFKNVPPSKASTFVKFKCRGIDPLVRHEGQVIRLSSVNIELANALNQTKEKAKSGWPIQLMNQPKGT